MTPSQSFSNVSISCLLFSFIVVTLFCIKTRSHRTCVKSMINTVMIVQYTQSYCFSYWMAFIHSSVLEDTGLLFI